MQRSDYYKVRTVVTVTVTVTVTVSYCNSTVTVTVTIVTVNSSYSEGGRMLWWGWAHGGTSRVTGKILFLDLGSSNKSALR